MSSTPSKVKEFNIGSELTSQFGFVKATVVNSYLTLRHKSGGTIRCEFDSKNLPRFKKKLENAIAANENEVKFDSNFDSRKFSLKFIDLLVKDAEEEYTKHQEEIKKEWQNAQKILDEIKQLRVQ